MSTYPDALRSDSHSDECEGPPNFKDLADKTGYGLNVNGSVCLNNICMSGIPLLSSMTH